MSKVWKGIITIPVIAAILSIISNIILALLLTLTYASLTKESVIATIKFDIISKKDKIYMAHLYSRDNKKIGDYKIFGDQWRIDAAFIKMKYWANILGVDSKYTLNRIEGRYKNIDDENSKKHKSYLLETHKTIDIFNFFVDTEYGSSIYKNIELNTIYTVLKSPTGLMVREHKVNIKKDDNFLDKTKKLFGI